MGKNEGIGTLAPHHPRIYGVCVLLPRIRLGRRMVLTPDAFLIKQAREAIALADYVPAGIEDEHVQQGLEDMHDAAALYGKEAWQAALLAALAERLSSTDIHSDD